MIFYYSLALLKFLYFCYHTLMTRISLSIASTLIGLSMPLAALAYMTPEQVLLSESMYLPPRTRESQDRVERQRQVSANRREQEQEEAFAIQNPPDEPERVEDLQPAAPVEGALTADDRSLLRTLRLLQRADNHQRDMRVMQYAGDHRLRGAPPLAPTGAGSVAISIVMVGAVVWTMRRAKRDAVSC